MSEGQTGEWFYLQEGGRIGPVSEAALRERMREGVVESGTLVRMEGMPAWESAAVALPGCSAVLSLESASSGEAVFFPVSVPKFAVMSLVTFGFYDLYWAFRNWWYIRRTQKLKIMPFWRAWFVLFFTYSLLKRIRAVLRDAGSSVAFSPGWLAIGYLVALLFGRLPMPFAFISFLAWAFLVPVVDSIDDVNRERLEESELNSRFSGWNVFGIVVGGLCWILIVVGLFVL